MAAEQPNNIKKPLCAGLLAHVDAGKTTLSEAMLYEAGARRTLGRVDHQDAFLDTHALERARGITIFSKQALLETEHRAVTLVDTPAMWTFPPKPSASCRCWTAPCWLSAAPTACRPTP